MPHLSDEQLDDLLKRWKRKGAERSLGFIAGGAIVAAITGVLVASHATPSNMLIACITYFCAVAALAVFTLP